LFRHWEPPEATQDPDSQRPFDDLWSEVVAEHLVSDVPVGLLLSGGLDSTAVALAIANSKPRVCCTTIALPGSADESPAAAQTAAMLGLPHSRVALGVQDVPALLSDAAAAFDEPQGFGALLTMTRVAQAARARGKVVLAGDGGDEAFAGYTWHRRSINRPPTTDATAAAQTADPFADNTVREAALQDLAAHSYAHAHLQAVMPRFHPAEAQSLLAPLGARYNEHLYASWLAEEDRKDLPHARRAQRLDLLGFCAGSILPKVDRAAMGVGLEVRTPFLDKRLLSWALAQPASPVELDAATSKPVLRTFLAGRVPEGTLSREKQGFSLRLSRADVFTSMEDWLAQTKLMTSGVLNEHWRGFVGPGSPSREARMFALCMMAAWAEVRL
jgi:asparagine synthase (glutamine-hydrolysing)